MRQTLSLGLPLALGSFAGALAALETALARGFDDAAALARLRGEKLYRALLEKLTRRAVAG